MEIKTIEQRVEYIAFLHKQNLNGRETEDELFEAGILAGMEETLEEIEDLLKTAWKVSEQNMRSQFSSSAYKGVTFEQWFNEFKNK